MAKSVHHGKAPPEGKIDMKTKGRKRIGKREFCDEKEGRGWKRWEGIKIAMEI